MKLIAVALLFISVNTFGQLYVHRTFDFQDSLNSQWFRKRTDNISVILVDAYLTGKLKGYRFDTGYEVLKRAPLPEELIPQLWSPKDDYFMDDRVVYNGKFYVAQADGPRGKTPVQASDYWSEYIPYGEPVSDRHYFPALADTLGKSEFPKNFLMTMGQTFEPWTSDYDYYVSDYVNYNGTNYEALRDNHSKIPTESPDDWMRTNAGSPYFYPVSELRGISVLYYSEEINGKQVLTPQLITPRVWNDNMGFLDDMELHFYYSDVINYLNSVREPLLYNSKIGNVKDRIVLDWDERANLADVLFHQLRSGMTKPGKRDIINASEFQRFLNETEKPSVSAKWTAFQDVKSTDIIISRIDFYRQKPIVKITAKSLSRFPLSKASEVLTALEAMESGKLNFWMDTTQVDSLPPLKSSAVTRKALDKYFSREQYLARVDSGYNAKLLAALKPAWEMIKKEFYAGRLKTVTDHYEPFQLDYTFPRIEVEGWIFTDLKFRSCEYPGRDSLATTTNFTDVRVCYTRKFGTTTPYSFVPENVSILIIQDEATGISEPYTFEWSKLKALLSTSPETKRMIGLIESGDLLFAHSELDYGLMEDR
jgi:hypothetical protein